MAVINLDSSISPRLQELIQEANHSIQTVKEKILVAYNYAIKVDNLPPKTAAKILREKLDFSDRYIREVLPLEAKELKFANKSIPKNDDHDQQAERVPPSLNEVPTEEYQEDGSNKVVEESDSSDKFNITTTPYDVKENETMVKITPFVNDLNKEIENFNEDPISSTTTTITTINDENMHQPSTSSAAKIIEPNEFLRQYNEIEILKQMLYNQRQENRYLVNEIRELRGAEPLKYHSKNKRKN
jgi:hypothetical protein